MASLFLKNAKAVGQNKMAENFSILIENEMIADITERNNEAEEIIDLEGAAVFAGFIDIHNHGAVGFDVNEMADMNDLIEVGKFLASEGVTAWLPTFVPDSDETFRRVVSEINSILEVQKELPIAQIVGLHYEGVFANEKMCGALRPEYFKNFTKGDEIAQLPKLKSGVHLTTIAPEIENGIELIGEFVKQNWIVSIGHTKADIETLEKAKRVGAKHLTHFFNAMSGIHHRDTGVAGWGLISDGVTFDIIADGIHVAPEMLKFAVQTKLPENVSLISDSVAPTGLGDGDFELWGERISVVKGKTQNESGSIAGSVSTMLQGVKNVLSLGFSKNEVSKMASANPAKLLGLEKTHGSIEKGKRADLVVLGNSGNVKLVIIGGKIVIRNA